MTSRPRQLGVAALLLLSALAVVRTAPSSSAASGLGEVAAFGTAPALGSAPGAGIVAMVATPSGQGYWLVGRDGGVFSFGDAGFFGSTGNLVLNQPVVAAARTPTGKGYWLVARDGGVFSFGDAGFHGSTGNLVLNQPVVAMAPTPSGKGYWLVASDGGVFAFGDARFFGSTGHIVLNQPVVGAAATPSGGGYWMTARDGGVFAFGDAGFHGSTGNIVLNEPVVAMAATASGNGYWFTARDGGVFTFGDATFHGSGLGRFSPGQRVVAMAATPDGKGYWLASSPSMARIMLAGDVHGEDEVARLLARGENPLSAVAPLFSDADLVTVNLETPAAAPGTPQPKTYVFNAPVELLGALRAGGVDVVSLANNHALDHGATRLLDTIDNVRRFGLVPIGAGRDAAEAYRPAYLEVNGFRVAFIGLSRVLPPGWAAGPGKPGVASGYDEAASLNAVREAAGRADAVVVMIHWGVELAPCANGEQRSFADRLMDAGATVVGGHHPHVLQGPVHRGTRMTAFSLGNFVWYHNRPPSDATGILDVTVDSTGVQRSTFHPASIGSDGRPYLLGGDAATHARNRFLSSGAC